MRNRFYVFCQLLCISLGSLFTLSSHAALNPQQTTSLAPILQDVMPAVVNIKTVHPPVPTLLVDPNTGKQYPVPQRDEQRGGLASGVIVDASKGYILTNFHAINGAREISVVLSDGRNFPAKPVGGDPLSDVAVIQIPAEKLTQIKLGDSDNLQVGDFVVAIGNPFGLNHSVTSGIISALGRSELGIEGIEDFIQTDASINPGNSGGALIDMNGNLIGINTAIISPGRDPGNIGIGLAIPINMAHSLMMQLIEFGEVRRGIMGVSVQTLTHEYANVMGVPQGGALIANVAPSSVADKAGVKPGDIVIALNDKPVKSAAQLRNQIGVIPIGGKVKFTLIRHKKEEVLSFDLLDPRSLPSPEVAISPLFEGLELSSIHKTLAGHGDIHGLEVLTIVPGSPAARARLREGDVIVSVNQKEVSNLKSLAEAVKHSQDSILVRFLRGRDGGFTILTVGKK